MSISIVRPSPILAPFIKQYWMVRNQLPSGDSYIQRIVPNGLMELSFYLGSKPKFIKNGNQHVLDNSLLTGQLLNFFDVEISDTLDLFSISFQPQGAMRLFDLPLNELINETISYKSIFGSAISAIEERLFYADTFEDRVKVIEYFLYEKLVKKHDYTDLQRIDSCVMMINNSHGNIRVEDLASETCLSRKQFERVFLKSVGISPKQFLRVVRFQNAIYQKQLNAKQSLTNLALDCGYYDQSHMINDFKSLSGTPPKEFFEDCMPYSDYFSG
jgi:AraC-like DNA-binding protein